MSIRVYAQLTFPQQYMDEAIQKALEKYTVEEYVEDGLFTISNSEQSQGEYEELEALLVEKKVPFDRSSEAYFTEFPAEIRHYRPDNDFDKTIVVTNDFEPFIHTETLHALLKRHVLGEIGKAELLIQISSLLREQDPMLTKVIKPLSDYVK